ncbi:MAG: hypothetical protein EPO03_08180 [Porticoccaceae bacterium]|nr:MAG: hypothetical protein EPO03_08180 [Porticoccaceae bacterium]
MSRPGRLVATLWEADQHAAMLAAALAEWDRAPAADWESLEAHCGHARPVDQVLFGFIKLQDVLGERLAPLTLAALKEPHAVSATHAQRDRLEELGYLDVDAWLAWRGVRDRLAREYPHHRELRFAALLAGIAAARALLGCYAQWRERLAAAGIAGPGTA